MTRQIVRDEAATPPYAPTKCGGHPPIMLALSHGTISLPQSSSDAARHVRVAAIGAQTAGVASVVVRSQGRTAVCKAMYDRFNFGRRHQPDSLVDGTGR